MMTTHWTAAWEKAIAPLVSRRHLLLACDFDGTLAPIAPTPMEAVLPKNTHVLLRKLSGCPGVTLAFVSGRALGDVRTKIDLDGAYYCGNHGMEIEGPGLEWQSAGADALREELAQAVAAIRKETQGVRGLIVEDKGLTASVHWRLVSERDLGNLRSVVSRVTASFPDLQLFNGKAVWELRPRVGRNKGTALTSLLDHVGLTPADALFLGDDITDEGAFEAAKAGVTVRVGQPAETAARYRANDVSDAAGFLFCFFVARAGAALRGSSAIDPAGTGYGVEEPHPIS